MKNKLCQWITSFQDFTRGLGVVICIGALVASSYYGPLYWQFFVLSIATLAFYGTTFGGDDS